VPPCFDQTDLAPSRTGSTVVALALLEDDGELELGPGGAELVEDCGLDLLDLLAQVGASAAAGELTTLSVPGFVVHAIGVGDTTPAALRKAGAALARATRGVDQVASSVHSVAAYDGLAAFVAGAVLGSFRYSLRTTEAGTRSDAPVGRILLAGAPVDATELSRAAALLELAAQLAMRVPAEPRDGQVLLLRDGSEVRLRAATRVSRTIDSETRIDLCALVIRDDSFNRRLRAVRWSSSFIEPHNISLFIHRVPI